MSWVITGSEKNPVDLYRSQVSLLLHGDGANGSTTITDSSPTPKAVTAVGNAQISTAQSKFGGSSISVGTTTSDRLIFASAGNIDFEFPDDFTWEAWIYPNASTCGVYLNSLSVATSFRVFVNGGVLSANIAEGVARSFGNITIGQWQHIAIVRSSASVVGYVDGLSGTSYSHPGTITNGGNAQISNIGGLAFNGFIDDLRITKGVARYTANFTPPTAPFPDI